MTASIPSDQTTWVQHCAAHIIEFRPHLALPEALAAARDLWGAGWSAFLPYVAANAACEPLPNDPPYTEFEWVQLYAKRALERTPELAGDDASEMACLALERGDGRFDPYQAADGVFDDTHGRRGVGEPDELPKQRGVIVQPPPRAD